MFVLHIKLNNYLLKFLILNYLLFFLFLYIYLYIYNNKIKNKHKFSNSLTFKNYSTNKFIIIKHTCKLCGLFSFYKVSLGCIHKYLLEGYIPIIDIKSYPNIINGFNTSKNNFWEYFFNQPFGYNLEEVLKNAKIIKEINDPWKECDKWPNQGEVPFENVKRYFWHDFAKKYSPIKKKLFDLSEKIMFKLFKGSKNILGVLARGTDYVAVKPKGHPIPPNISDIIKFTKKMDDENNYDYIFFSSEDEIYRDNFSKSFPIKSKQIKSNIKMNYNYSKKQYLCFNKNVSGNIEFNKIYLLNIIILSKCLDLIAAKCNGAIGIFILTNGFRKIKIFNLGAYN